MKIFITGSSGFVGRAVVDEAVAQGHDVVALVHQKPVPDRGGRVASLTGGLFDESLIGAMAACSAVIHLIGIIAEKADTTFEKIHVEGTRRIVEAAKTASIRRYIQMSALGTRAGAVSNYHQTKFAAEQLVRQSGLDWTILQPSMIHGPDGEFMQWVAQWARGRKAPFLFMPYFGSGIFGFGRRSLIQPIFVHDVARAFVESLTNDRTIGQTYALAGPETMTWPEFHRRCSRAITGRPKLTLPIPAWYAKLLTRLLPAKLLPFNWDQVVMSQEDNTADISRFVSDFGWRPAGFDSTLAKYADRL